MTPFALAFALTAAASSHGPVPELDSAVASVVREATALVRVRGASGSAFVIGTHRGRLLLLTNAHVLKSPRGIRSTGIEIILDAGTASQTPSLPADVIGLDQVSDLALLATSAPGRPRRPLAIARRCDRLAGTPIYAAGFPYGDTLASGAQTPSVNLSPGVVSSRQEYQGLIELFVGINPGNSGGPVVTTDGVVLGVAVANERRTDRSLAVSCAEIQEFVTAWAEATGWLEGFRVPLRDVTTSARSATVVAPRPLPVEPDQDGVLVFSDSDPAVVNAYVKEWPVATLGSPGGRGTAFAVARRGDDLYLATADAAMFRYRYDDGVSVRLPGEAKPRRGKLVALADRVALVEVPQAGAGIVPLLVSKRVPRATESVRIVGFEPSALESDPRVRVETGNVSAVRERGTILQLDFGVNGGLLGGPVVDDEGYVLAVAPRRGPGTNVTLGVTGLFVEALMEKVCGERARLARARAPRPVANDVAARYERGRSYASARPPSRRFEELAAGEYEAACARDHGDACGALGILYLEGRGVAKDHERARWLLRKACSLGAPGVCDQLWASISECPE